MKTFTAQELQAMTVKELTALYVEMQLQSTRMNDHFIVKDWLIEDILNGKGK